MIKTLNDIIGEIMVQSIKVKTQCMLELEDGTVRPLTRGDLTRDEIWAAVDRLKEQGVECVRHDKVDGMLYCVPENDQTNNVLKECGITYIRGRKERKNVLVFSLQEAA